MSKHPKFRTKASQKGTVRLIGMLKQELKELANVEEIVGKDPKDILLSIKFRDGHIHTVYPDDETASEMYENMAIDFGFNMEAEPSPANVIDLARGGPSLVDTRMDRWDRSLPKRIVFHNRQAIGDILMFTCAVRDFKRAFPNIDVKVESTAMHIWDNNPNICHDDWPEVLTPHDFQKDTSKRLEGNELKQATTEAIMKAVREDVPVKLFIGPGRATNASNRSDNHFANAFRLSIEDALGVDIEQGAIRPDIYMAQAEYDAPPLVEPPYWLITAGEKGDWTAKTYSFSRWQKVIELLPDIKFVQIGSKGHKHPDLTGPNVINYIGKTEDRHTGIRNLFNLFLNCEGSAGLVSFQMHLAAAFNKPCVVIAGAREPVWFTRYPGQQYLASDGCLPCTANNRDEPKACWICDINRCPHIDKAAKQLVPLCEDLFTAEEVAGAIMRYYDGGRLSLVKSMGKSKLVNIHTPKPEILAKQDKSVKPIVLRAEDELLKGWGFTWGNTSITGRDWDFIKKVITDYKVKRVFETGCGLSSLLIKNVAGCDLMSFDSVMPWIEKMEKVDPDLKITGWDGKTKLDLQPDFFDMAFIDGPSGGNNREPSFSSVVDKVPVIVVHDAGRAAEKEWQAKYLFPAGYKLISKGGHRCHLWTKGRTPTPTIVEKGDRVVKMFFNGRGEGGAETSTTHIMNGLQERGYRVQYYSPSGNPSGNFSAVGNKGIPVLNAFTDVSAADECGLAILYMNDWVWDIKKENVIRIMESIRAERKVMIINYRMGHAGDVEWTRSWDQYLFLNSGLQKLFLERYPGAKTKAMAPPVDLAVFEAHRVIDYSGPLKIVRHSSQGDVKYPEDFNVILRRILAEIDNVEIHLMPAPTFLNDDRVNTYKRNQPPVWEFLMKGNVFWYKLPEGYQDQGPKVIMEAQAAGLPVVADNHSGAKDRIVSASTGYLCDSVTHHVQALKLLQDPALREQFGQRAFDHARETYDIESWLAEIIG